MKVGVIGGRNFSDFGKMIQELSKHEITMIISGGAKGADTLAYQYATMKGITFVCHPPLREEVETMGFARSAKRRNLRIVESSDMIIAFPDSDSKGTWHTVGLAKKLKKQVIVIKP